MLLSTHCCFRRKTIIFPSQENPMLFTVWPKNLFPWRLGIINNLRTNWNVWPTHDVFCLLRSQKQATPSTQIPIFHLSYFWIYWTTFNSALSFLSSINPFSLARRHLTEMNRWEYIYIFFPSSTLDYRMLLCSISKVLSLSVKESSA